MDKHKTILIVEDDEAILSIVKEMLEDEGYLIQTASNGHEALKVLQKEGIPGLILLDMKMPVMDGWHFAAEFNARYDHSAPTVVMTAAGDAEQRAEDIHADAWLGKPFGAENLLSTVKHYIK